MHSDQFAARKNANYFHLHYRIAVLNQQAEVEKQKRKRAQVDFGFIEDDYARFLNVNPARCHSDFVLTSKKAFHSLQRSTYDKSTQSDFVFLNQKDKCFQTKL